ncbi:MAG: hypothetical protein R3E66_06505 [bacterium]
MAILAVLGACDSSTGSNNDGFKPDPVIHSLPRSQPGEALCTEGDKVDLVGGDLMASADRIVVGTVTNIDVVDEFAPPSPNCDLKTISWTLRVTLRVDENLKGSGSEAEFTISRNSQYLFWETRPLHKQDDVWLPEGFGAPVFQVSESLGWTGQDGLQPGQELLVFLWQEDDYYPGPGYMPMAQRQDDGTFKFQADSLPGGCVKLPKDMLGADLDTLRRSLETESTTNMDNFIAGSLSRFSSCSANGPQNASDADVGVDQ